MDKENTFIGADGVIYCSVCHEPMEFKLPTPLLEKFDRLPRQCACHRLQEEKEEKERRDREHAETVSRNKRVCFHEKRMQEWTFEHDNGSTPAMNRARAFVEHWDEVRNAKVGLMFWGGIGIGKTYMAACITNAGCTRMTESGMDMKVVQYLMGHSNIDVKMDVYNHITEQSRIETEVAKLNSTVV